MRLKLLLLITILAICECICAQCFQVDTAINAKEVMKHFVNLGIDKNRIEPVGMGELQNGKINPFSRKVEIKVLKKAPE